MNLLREQERVAESELSFTVFSEIRRVVLNPLLAEIDAGLVLAELSAAMRIPEEAATARTRAWACYQDCIISVGKHELLEPGEKEFILSRAALLRETLAN